MSGAATEAVVGQALPEVVVGPVDRTRLVKYAGASGDFNRMHFDDEFARGGGFDAVIAHGMLSMAVIGQLLSRWAGPTSVRRIKVRFKAPTLLGETITARGEITALHVEGSQRTAEVRLWTETRPGHTTLEGTATVALA